MKKSYESLISALIKFSSVFNVSALKAQMLQKGMSYLGKEHIRVVPSKDGVSWKRLNCPAQSLLKEKSVRSAQLPELRQAKGLTLGKRHRPDRPTDMSG